MSNPKTYTFNWWKQMKLKAEQRLGNAVYRINKEDQQRYKHLVSHCIDKVLDYDLTEATKEQV